MARNPAKEGIVAILHPTKGIAGAGILVDDRHVMTCAHVVNSALNRPQDAEQPPEEAVSCFSAVDPQLRLTAHVVKWLPMRNELSNEPQDVAVLELDGELPESALPVRFVEPEDAGKKDHFAFGFPPGKRRGNRASCKLAMELAGGWWQLDPASAKGIQVQPGFSGTAVFVEETGLAVGMVVAADKDRDAGVAYMISSTQLDEVWPLLKKPEFPPDYRDWLNEQYSDVSLLGLKVKQGQSFQLSHVYVPLTSSQRLREDAPLDESDLEENAILQGKS